MPPSADGAWIHLCILHAKGLPATGPPNADRIRAGIWEAATAADRVQHVRVIPTLARLDIGIVLMAMDNERAYAVAARISAAALAADPDTHGWTLTRNSVPNSPDRPTDQ
jgi:hypothetical protein